MALITQFDDLPDLFFIDLFNYLSSIDILWAFTNLNNRIQTIINERGFFRHINLSSARLSKFYRLLTIFPLNQIEALIIDIEASPLQLSRWPYLPHLTTLRLYGLRDFIDATNFILRHSTSLIHLALETNDLFMSMGFTGYISHPRGRLSTLVENVLPHLSALCSLDLGQDIGLGLTNWYITTIQSPLNYLRVPMEDIPHLCHVISRETLSTTLEQLHVTMRGLHFNIYPWAYDVWYTLPWAFEQFFEVVEPIQYITKVEVFALPSSYSSIISSSRLRTLNHINTVHLSFYDWPTGLNLMALRHVILTNNLVALKNFSSFPSNIRSIQILFRANMPNFVSSN
ncbi:unnamed protein product [Rotaria sp. Silwood1]|nr:unnamed protein product [Rotaria sp. Silwood1]CAF0737058.1 unnamed protein product [Rotaria sp. Silwood1]